MLGLFKTKFSAASPWAIQSNIYLENLGKTESQLWHQLWWKWTDRKNVSSATDCKERNTNNKTLREQTLQVYGVKLFNKLPWELRSLKNCGVDEFKEKLEKFLTAIPDQPNVGNQMSSACNQITGRPSNSLLDWIPILHQNLRRRNRA